MVVQIVLAAIDPSNGEDVVPAAGSIPDNPVYWPRRIGLRPRDTRDRRQSGSACCEMQKISAGEFQCRPTPRTPQPKRLLVPSLPQIGRGVYAIWTTPSACSSWAR